MGKSSKLGRICPYEIFDCEKKDSERVAYRRPKRRTEITEILQFKLFTDESSSSISYSPWVFTPIEERLDKIFVQISEGKRPADREFTLVINALMKYQENLKRLLGYETIEKLEEIYPFKQWKRL